MPASRDLVFRILGVIVGVALGAVTAVLAAVLTPLYIGSVRSPLAVIVALVGNAAITYFTYVVVRHAGLALLPGVAWLVVMFLALTKTSEGDLIVTGTWVGGLTFLCGCIGWAGTGYFLIVRRAAIGRARSVPGLPGYDVGKAPSAGATPSKKSGPRTRTKAS